MTLYSRLATKLSTSCSCSQSHKTTWWPPWHRLCSLQRISSEYPLCTVCFFSEWITDSNSLLTHSLLLLLKKSYNIRLHYVWNISHGDLPLHTTPLQIRSEESWGDFAPGKLQSGGSWLLGLMLCSLFFSLLCFIPLAILALLLMHFKSLYLL